MEKREIKTPSVTEQVKAKEKTGKKGGASTQQPRALDRAAKKEIQAKGTHVYSTYHFRVPIIIRCVSFLKNKAVNCDLEPNLQNLRNLEERNQRDSSLGSSAAIFSPAIILQYHSP
ncbi:unnamed protein product [Sphenostylis stenocarpa]|uniref:Uncharacterized protein n=1 Tax=Sphenostylis stenocarpa TaxID=92480 RepID=A0AA86S038_9FABA|nr:unnamed protein product [Sphenostylis stenocarpa]